MRRPAAWGHSASAGRCFMPASGPRLVRADAVEAPRTVLHLDFAADDPGQCPVARRRRAAMLTTDPAEEVGGRRSLKGDSRAVPPSGTSFSTPRRACSTAKQTYKVSFDYRVIARAANARFYALFRAPGGDGKRAVRAGRSGQGDAGAERACRNGVHHGGESRRHPHHRHPEQRGAGDQRPPLLTDPAARPPGLPAPERTWKSPGRHVLLS